MKDIGIELTECIHIKAQIFFQKYLSLFLITQV